MTDENTLLEKLSACEGVAYHHPDGGMVMDGPLLQAAIDCIGVAREALTQIARLRTNLKGDFSLGSKQSDIARIALEKMA